MTEESTFEQKLKYWEQLRNAIVHEDNLVNYRLTWLLTTEWFLLSFFAIIQAAILSKVDTLSISIILCTELLLLMPTFLMMVWLCIISGSMITAALRQVQRIQNAWIKRYPEEKHDNLSLPNWMYGEEYQPNYETPDEKLTQFPPIIAGLTQEPC